MALDQRRVEAGMTPPAAIRDDEAIRSVLVEADSFISHMHHRHKWPGDDYEVNSLIGRLRSTAKSLEPVVRCGEQFETTDYVSACELPQGHDGPHKLVKP